MSLRDMLGLRPKAETAAALRAALAEAEGNLSAARLHLSTLEATRGAILLDGTGEEVATHEAAITAARNDIDRLGAMIGALPPRIAEAEGRERSAALDKLTEAAEADAREGAELVPRIVKALAEAAELVTRHDALAERVRAANRELRADGRDKVPLPTARAWPQEAATVPVLAPHMTLPGPRGPCATLAAWRAELARVEALSAG